MFTDRIHAGQLLADRVAQLHLENPCLLAVPRGGVVVAAPVAQKLNLEIHLLITRKLGHPRNPEVAIGAVMPDGSAMWDSEAVTGLAIEEHQLDAMIAAEHGEIKRRLLAYTGSDTFPQMTGKTALLIDDGIATGYTIAAALHWLKGMKPQRIVIAVPVGPPDVVAALSEQGAEVICLVQPYDFMAVGQYYHDFSQTSDQEVIDLLNR